MSFQLSYGRKFRHFLGKTPRVSRPHEPSPLSVIFLPREARSLPRPPPDHTPSSLPHPRTAPTFPPTSPPDPRRGARPSLFPQSAEAIRQP